MTATELFIATALATTALHAEWAVEVEARKVVNEGDGRMKLAPYAAQPTRTVETLEGFKPCTTKSGRFGGMIDRRYKASGFYRVEKIGARWWVIDPEGHPMIHVSVGSVRPGRAPATEKALAEHFRDKVRWRDETFALLREHGFNAVGAWSDENAVQANNQEGRAPLGYAINLNLMQSYGAKRGGTYQKAGHRGYPKDAIFVFDPEFPAFCEEALRSLSHFRDDPYLFGYFSDNELPFPPDSLDRFLDLPGDDAGRRAAEAWLARRSVGGRRGIDEGLREKFRAHVAATYAGIVSTAVKKHDPHHLFLGPRLYGREKHTESFVRALAPHIDVLSCNYYGRWTPVAEEMHEWAGWTGRPFMITEFYTKGEDSGMGNRSGAGWIVRTQNDRGLFYQNYCLALLESKNCIGWTHFRYQDNHSDEPGSDPSNSDANKGIVDNQYRAWTPFLQRMKELNQNVYALIDHFDQSDAEKSPAAKGQ